jgi:hypothetical protein
MPCSTITLEIAYDATGASHDTKRIQQSIRSALTGDSFIAAPEPCQGDSLGFVDVRVHLDHGSDDALGQRVAGICGEALRGIGFTLRWTSITIENQSHSRIEY